MPSVLSALLRDLVTSPQVGEHPADLRTVTLLFLPPPGAHRGRQEVARELKQEVCCREEESLRKIRRDEAGKIGKEISRRG